MAGPVPTTHTKLISPIRPEAGPANATLVKQSEGYSTTPETLL